MSFSPGNMPEGTLVLLYCRVSDSVGCWCSVKALREGGASVGSGISSRGQDVIACRTKEVHVQTARMANNARKQTPQCLFLALGARLYLLVPFQRRTMHMIYSCKASSVGKVVC